MELSLFKNVTAKPSAVSAVCSNNSTVVLFRANGVLDLMDSYTFKTYMAIEFKYRVLSSAFLDLNTVVCGTECGKLVFLDIQTLETAPMDVFHRPARIAARFNVSGWSEFHYCTDDGAVYRRTRTESVLAHRNNPATTCLLVSNGILIVGSADGRIRALEGSRTVCELEVSEQRINMICFVSGNKYAAACEDGSFSYFDIEVGMVIQTVRVRDSPLNVCAHVGNRLHLSGADSRVIAFSRSGDKFIKSYQVDTHYAEVRDIAIDNGRIITVGEDSLMSIVWPTTDRYLENKVFSGCAELGVSKVSEQFLVNNRSSIDIYSFDAKSGAEKQENAQMEDETTFRLLESSAENIGYRRQPYRHTVRVSSDDWVFSCCASPDFRHIAYSNSRETKVMVLETGEIEGGLETANRVLMTNSLLVVQTRRCEVLLIDILSRQTVARISLCSHKDTVYCVQDMVVLGHSKTVHSMSGDEIGRIDISEDVVGVCDFDGCNLFVLAVARSTEPKKRYIGYRVSAGWSAVRIHSFESYAVVSSVFCFRGQVGFFSANAIHILDRNMKEQKYPLGAVIYGCDGMKDGMVAIQDSWSNVRLGLPPSVFKEKFSNK